MKLTVDIIEEFINSLDLSGLVLSSSNDGTYTTIEVEKTFHARKGMTLDVDGTDYPITSVTDNTQIIVLGVIANPITYTVSTPFYFHGTPIMTQNHISNADPIQKYPMIYLYEIIRERERSILDGIDRDSELRVFFLDEADYSNWSTDEHYTNRLKGLNNLVDEFKEKAIDYRCCFYLDETVFTRINHVNWGVNTDLKGHVRNIFADHLTGVELSFTLPIKKC